MKLHAKRSFVGMLEVRKKKCNDGIRLVTLIPEII